MTSHSMPDAYCPVCHHRFNACTQVHGDPAAPAPGNITCCIGCGEVLVFDDHLRPRLMPEEVKQALSPEERAAIERTLAAIAKVLTKH